MIYTSEDAGRISPSPSFTKAYDESAKSVDFLGNSEKHDDNKPQPSLQIYTDHRLHHSRFRWFWQISQLIDKFGEARGVARQDPSLRTRLDFWYYLRIIGIWFGATCSLPSMTGFFLGPLLYNLSFKAAVSSSVLGCFAGTIIGAFGATMGPRSGLRSMMGVRYQFGWWFGKLLALLNCCTLIGWLMVNGFFGGQLLAAISGQRISIEIGILVLFLVVMILAVFGWKLLALFDTVLLIPLIVSFLLCYICTGHEFVVDRPSLVSGLELRTAWVTNFQACIGITSTWVGVASDYHLDMPEGTNKKVLYVFVMLVMFIPTAFVGILGCGLASAGLYEQRKADIYSKYGGAGLIVDGMDRWHGGGMFLCVLMYLSLITNGGLTTYSFGLSFQTLAIPIARFPRYILVLLGSVLWYVLTSVGQEKWANVVSNFLPMIGYWSLIYGAILTIETLWFRRHAKDNYEWDQYLNSKHFPIMWAAMLAFGFGVAGVVIGMDQYYYVGRVAQQIGKGCELGSFFAFGFSALSYIPLRYLELYLRKSPKIVP